MISPNLVPGHVDHSHTCLACCTSEHSYKHAEFHGQPCMDAYPPPRRPFLRRWYNHEQGGNMASNKSIQAQKRALASFACVVGANGVTVLHTLLVKRHLG